MKLSILIPMYNAQDFIIRCLDSLVQQNIPENEYEILVMDDGSTDDSKSLVEDYSTKHPQITLFPKENEGAYTTRNRLLKLAKGDYIYNVDADDYVKPHCLGTLITYGLSENADLIEFNTAVTSSSDNVTCDDKIDIQKAEVISGPEFLKNNRNFRVEVWWYIIKRKFLEKNQMVFSKNEYNADVIFTVNCFLKASKVLFYPIPVYTYFQSPNSIMRSNNNEKNLLRIQYSYEMLLDFSKLINDIENSEINHKNEIVDILGFRRDTFLFFLLIRIIRAKFRPKKLTMYLQKLDTLNAYPLKKFLQKEHNITKYKVLLITINNRSLLFAANRIGNLMSRHL